MEKYKLTDLIEVSLLQRMQDMFASMTGMAAVTIDNCGAAVTKGSKFSQFSQSYVLEDLNGNLQNIQAVEDENEIFDRYRWLRSCLELVDFEASIAIEGEVLGRLIGGQALAERPDQDTVRSIAFELGMDWTALQKGIEEIPVMTEEQIEAASEYLSEIAKVLSDIAYGKYMSLETMKEVEHAANMKTDFLANMSHEIRTPMNAVIGLAEVALREELSDVARDCLMQIKSSGNALLMIINDILDFSKIESGKMDIIPVEYEPLELFNDIINILSLRIKDKPIEPLLTILPTFPKTLYGDNLRVRQVLINIANNAAKFTHEGKIVINVGYQKLSEEDIDVKVDIIDTGIGIKEKDLKKIFKSFQQVDSKRNRNVEGTGLGLAISKQLVEMMGGNIEVKSEYGEGSIFTIHIHQKVVDWSPSIVVKQAEKKAAVGFWNNPYISKEFYRNIDNFRILSMGLPAIDSFEDVLMNYVEYLEGKQIYFFFDEASDSEEMMELINKYSSINFILLTENFSKTKHERHNVYTMCKPVSTQNIAMALNGEEKYEHINKEKFELDFVAPDAKVLIVDDNEVNLTVAQGLLEPLQMQLTKATSGVMALELIKQNEFDLIFMDHMMPELDGVETTRIIRRYHPSYAEVPIIALTANVMQGIAETFMAEGMNDFVAKPIEIREIIQVIKKWLPKNKIVKGTYIAGPKIEGEERIEAIGDLDIHYAIELLGGKELYFKILKEYYRNIQVKSVRLKELQMNKDIQNYTIEVHALKSLSRQIGATALADMAARLEQAGHEEDYAFVDANTDNLLQKYVEYIDILKPFCQEEETDEAAEKDKPEVEKKELLSFFEQLTQAMEELDIDTMEHIISTMKQYHYPVTYKECFDKLCTGVDNIDIDACMEIIENWKSIL